MSALALLLCVVAGQSAKYDDATLAFRRLDIDALRRFAQSHDLNRVNQIQSGLIMFAGIPLSNLRDLKISEAHVKRFLVELIRLGSDIHSLDDVGGNCLHESAWHGNGIVAKALLEAGANPNVRLTMPGAGEDTPLTLALRTANWGVAKALIVGGADLEMRGGHAKGFPLSYAAYAGNLELVKLMVERGAKVNARKWPGKWLKPWAPHLLMEDGHTALHSAAMKDTKANAAVIRYLLKSGADPRIRTTGHETAYDLAKRTKKSIVLAALTGK